MGLRWMCGGFAGRVALVTGSGIAQAVAVRLAGEGACVVGRDVDNDGLARTQKQIEDAENTVVAVVGGCERAD